MASRTAGSIAPDGRLLDRVHQSSVDAFERLYDRYEQIAFTVAMRVLGEAHAAEDVVHQAFLRIWRNRDTYGEQQRATQMAVCSVVRSLALQRARGGRGQLPHELRRVDIVEEWQPTNGRRGAVAVSEKHVRSALATLTAEQRLTLELAYWDGMTEQQIASTLEVTIATVRESTRLGLERLAAPLTPSEA